MVHRLQISFDSHSKQFGINELHLSQTFFGVSASKNPLGQESKQRFEFFSKYGVEAAQFLFLNDQKLKFMDAKKVSAVGKVSPEIDGSML